MSKSERVKEIFNIPVVKEAIQKRWKPVFDAIAKRGVVREVIWTQFVRIVVKKYAETEIGDLIIDAYEETVEDGDFAGLADAMADMFDETADIEKMRDKLQNLINGINA